MASEAKKAKTSAEIEGYTLDYASGWYICDTDPSWQYLVDQNLFFNTAAQQYFSRADDGTLQPYTAEHTTQSPTQSPAQNTAHSTAQHADAAHAAAHTGPTLTLSSGLACMQGKRPTQEDRHIIAPESTRVAAAPAALFAIFDGHLGVDAAEFCMSHFLKAFEDKLQGYPWDTPEKVDTESVCEAVRTCYTEIDASFLKLARKRRTAAGTCCLATHVLGRTLVTSHLGDSRAVLCKNGTAVQLSQDHKPDSESERLRVSEAGGHVVTVQGVARVSPISEEEFFKLQKQARARVPLMLAVARSIGDLTLKDPPLVSSHADVSTRVLTPEDEFIVLACDGVWDVLSNEDAISIVRPILADTDGGSQAARCRRAAGALVQRAYAAGSTDNISVVCIRLTWST